MLKKYLIAPGPTPIPEEVLLEMAKPAMHHRTSEFSDIFAEARNGLKEVLGTKNEVLILLSSGTAAMEAAITNTLSAGDKVLVVNAGKFGERWIEISKAYNLEIDILTYQWGKSAKAEDIRKRLIENTEIKAVLIQASETSTTSNHPIKEIATVVNEFPGTLLIVDGITSVGVEKIEMDNWGIDVLITGSQKAFMLPPGLAFIALSDKAWQASKISNLPKYYLDLNIELKNQLKNTTAWTPGVNLIYGLRKVISMLKSEGLDNVYKRHSICAEATRKAFIAMGLKLLAEDLPSSAATGAYLPENLDGGAFVKYLREKVGITIAGGQDLLSGKVIRVSHLGYHDIFDTIVVITAIEMALQKFGQHTNSGAALIACQEIFLQRLPEAQL